MTRGAKIFSRKPNSQGSRVFQPHFDNQYKIRQDHKNEIGPEEADGAVLKKRDGDRGCVRLDQASDRYLQL